MGNELSITGLRMRALNCARLALSIRGAFSDIKDADIKHIRFKGERLLLLDVKTYHDQRHRLVFDDGYPANASIYEFMRDRQAQTAAGNLLFLERNIRFRLRDGIWHIDSISDWGTADPDLGLLVYRK